MPFTADDTSIQRLLFNHHRQPLRTNMTSLALRFYLTGYSNLMMPRAMRRILARSQLHHAWLAGHMGVFKEGEGEDVVACGVCTRDSMRYRKGPDVKKTKLRKFVLSIISPFDK